MIYDEEFDLTWADSPPGWVELIGPIHELWGNPVFQRRYVIWRLKPAFGVRNSFFIGFAASLVINLLFRFVTDEEQALGLGFLVTVIVPAIVVLAFSGTRFFASCLIGTPMELRRELYSGMLGALLATPLSDAKIFLSECIAGIMRGLGAMEEVGAMIIGLLIPFIIVMWPQLWGIAGAGGIMTVWWAVFLIMVLCIPVVLNVMTTFAAGMYAILFPVSLAIPATVAHIWLLFMVPLAGAGWILGLLVKIESLSDLDPLIALLSIVTFELIVLTAMTALTAHLGVLAFARARRPGYYEPERATAARFLVRDRGSDVRFGDRI